MIHPVSSIQTIPKQLPRKVLVRKASPKREESSLSFKEVLNQLRNQGRP